MRGLKEKLHRLVESLLRGRLLIPKIRIVNRHHHQELHHLKEKKGVCLGKTSLPPPTRYPKPKPIPVPTSNPVFDYMPKFMVPFIEKVVDVISNGHCGFQAIAEFMGLTEESHIMTRHNLIKELKDHRDDYARVYAGEDRYNYILNGLHLITSKTQHHFSSFCV